MSKFICTKSGVEFHAFNYRLSYINGEIIYRDNGGRLLKCPGCTCTTPSLSHIEEESVDFSTINIGKFSSMSSEQKKESLKQRASMHQKTLEERRKHLDQNFTGTLTDKDI